MAGCTYTFALENAIVRKMKRIRFCMTLDTFTEEAAMRGLEQGKIVVEQMTARMPDSGRKMAIESFERNSKIAKSKIKHLARAKFIMGDYTDHILRLTKEIETLTHAIRNHDCGPEQQHPENLPEGARSR